MNKTTAGGGIRELPEAERPREKLLSRGAAFLSDAELLALLIGSGTPGASSLQLAEKVLSIEKTGLAGLVRCAPQEYMALSGIGEAKACIIAASVELGRRIAAAPAKARPRLDNPESVATLYLEEMRRLPKEVFRVLMLNVKNELIRCDDISVGGLSSSLSHPREVFYGAIRCGANSVILMHNHPSGDPTPSKEDLSTTRVLCDAGNLLGIRVVDHILIGDGRFVSFKQDGLL